MNEIFAFFFFTSLLQRTFFHCLDHVFYIFVYMRLHNGQPVRDEHTCVKSYLTWNISQFRRNHYPTRVLQKLFSEHKIKWQLFMSTVFPGVPSDWMSMSQHPPLVKIKIHAIDDVLKYSQSRPVVLSDHPDKDKINYCKIQRQSTRPLQLVVLMNLKKITVLKLETENFQSSS